MLWREYRIQGIRNRREEDKLGLVEKGTRVGWCGSGKGAEARV